jgi:hypothetical protein
MDFSENMFHVFLMDLYLTPQKIIMYVPLQSRQVPEPPLLPQLSPAIWGRKFSGSQDHIKEQVNSFQVGFQNSQSICTNSVPHEFCFHSEVKLPTWWNTAQESITGSPKRDAINPETPGSRSMCAYYLLLLTSTSLSVLYSCVSMKTRAPEKEKNTVYKVARLVSHSISIALRYTQLTTYANFKHHVWTKGYTVT